MLNIIKVSVNQQKQSFDREKVTKEIGSQKLKEIYTNMVRLRAFEDKIEEMLEQGFNIVQHSAAGQEATPITSCALINKEDYVMPYHRGWGWAIGKGMKPSLMLAEFLGKKTGYCNGKGGVHLADRKLKVMGRPGIQGAHISIAAGIGLSVKMRKENAIVLCYFGDGASNTCNFHEGINLAAVLKTPVVFCCENNGYEIFANIHETNSVLDIANRSCGYGIPGFIVDGNDVISIYIAFKEAIERARRGEGPSLIEAKTYRWRGHSRIDTLHYGVYRPKEEVDAWKKKCPIKRLENELLDLKFITKEEIEQIASDAKKEMDEAATFAKQQPFPEKDELLEGIYA